MMVLLYNFYSTYCTWLVNWTNVFHVILFYISARESQCLFYRRYRNTHGSYLLYHFFIFLEKNLFRK